MTDTTNNLIAGQYFVTITDFIGCTKLDSIQLTEPLELAGKAEVTSDYLSFDITCFGAMDGSVTANGIDGTAPYDYKWSTGDLTKSVSGLGAGNYIVTITDVNGCSITTNVSISPPPVLTVNAGVNQSVCVGTPVNISAVGNGGAGAFTYQWNNGLGAGADKGFIAESSMSYEVLITDENGCQNLDTVDIIIIACLEDCTNGYDDDLDGLTDCEDPDCQYETSITVLSNYNGQQIGCNGGSNGIIQVTVLDGHAAHAPPTYLWSNGATDQTVLNVAAGSYEVTVTDANGCVALDTIIVTEPDELVANAGADAFICLSVSTTLTGSAIGGHNGYAYSWNNGLGGGISHSVSPDDTTTYTLTVTDGNGCTAIDSVRVVIQACPEDCTNGIDDDLDGILDCDDPDCGFDLVIEAYPDNITACVGSANVSAKVSPLTADAPFTYKWSNGPTAASVSNLSVGVI